MKDLAAVGGVLTGEAGSPLGVVGPATRPVVKLYALLGCGVFGGSFDGILAAPQPSLL